MQLLTWHTQELGTNAKIAKAEGAATWLECAWGKHMGCEWGELVTPCTGGAMHACYYKPCHDNPDIGTQVPRGMQRSIGQGCTGTYAFCNAKQSAPYTTRIANIVC